MELEEERVYRPGCCFTGMSQRIESYYRAKAEADADADTEAKLRVRLRLMLRLRLS